VPEPWPRSPSLAEPEWPPLEPTAPRPPSRPKSPEEEALEARWQELKKAHGKDRIALFQAALEEKGLLDEEGAFHLLNEIFYETAKRGERDRFDALVASLRERLPEVYAANASYFTSWLIKNAVAARRWEALPALCDEMAEHGESNIDVYNPILDLLAYHGQLALLVQMHRKSWPRVKGSENIVPWGISAFAEHAILYEEFDHLERGGAPDATDPGLLERLAPFDVNPSRLAEVIDLVSGKRKTNWALADYDLKAPPKKKRRDREWDEDEDEDEDEEKEQDEPVAGGRHRLVDLSWEFLAHLHQEGVPYTKGEMAREEIVEYLLKRVDGELVERPSMYDSVVHGRKPGKHVPPEHVLCPDRATLDRFLAGFLDMFSVRRHKAVVPFEMMPAWLGFLEGRGLLSAEQRRTTLEKLRPLREALLKCFEDYADDPHLVVALRAWGDEPKPAGG
jgi:hypothetical protein